MAWATATTVTAGVTLTHRITQEGSAGELQATVVFSDGATYVVPSSELLTSSSDAALSVSGASASVAVGASSTCGELLSVSWSPCGSAVATAAVPVRVQLASAVSLELDVSDGRLAPPGDVAASSLGLPTQTTLTAVVAFDDGTEHCYKPSSLTKLTLVRL